MILIPLRTNSPIRRTPTANYALIAANVLIFLMTYDLTPPRRDVPPGAVPVRTGPLRESLSPYRLLLDGANPEMYQLFTYQFLHDGWMHLLGNLLFLWVFGNSVNAKMGQVPYVLFYLSCGAMAGSVYLSFNDATMLGASGSIAGVTSGFLVMFPRSRTSFFYWFFVIGYFELPSMILIVAKIIVYDNLIAPMFSGGAGVAYSAHISGYLAGGVVGMVLLWIRAVPRDQFDLMALWKRAYQRRAFAQAIGQDPKAQARAQYGRVARTGRTDDAPDGEPAAGLSDTQLDEVAEIRRQITDAFEANNLDAAVRGYLKLVELDASLVLPRQHQLDVANHLVAQQQHTQAAEAYEKYLAHYTTAEHAEQVRLMLGVIYAKYLSDYERAEAHLRRCRDALSDPRQLDQCDEWLTVAARHLGRPTPDTS